MSEAKNEVPDRKGLAIETCWDLSPLYASGTEWEADFRKLDGLLKEFQACRGHLGDSPEVLKRALEASDELGLLEERLYTYAHLRNDEDTSDGKNAGRHDRISAKLAELEGETAWFDPELLAVDPETFRAYRKHPLLAFYKRTLDDTERERAHTLSEPEERILGMSADAFGVSEKAFSMLNDADMRFPKIRNEQGAEVELTHGNYIKFLESADRTVRKSAFDACYDTYAGLKNTFAALLDGTVKTSVLEAKLRHFPSSLAASLFSDKVPESLYDNLIKAVHARLPLLHRYFKLRTRLLHMDKIEMFDIYNPLVHDAAFQVSWEEAVSTVRNALQVLGPEYTTPMGHAFRDRWIDVYECRGKRSGAYSSGCYRKPPYMLLNFKGNLNSISTLAHELGHSMHSWFSDRAQEYHYASYHIFVAEVASTTNELLLHHHLMQNAKDDSMRAYLLNNLLDEIRGTVFRQTMFAEFEREIHAMSEEGEPLTANELSARYHALNGKYHGDAVVNNDKIQFEWERIPHFHYNFYVYKYATGMSAAAKLAQDIIQGDTARYMAFLKAGDSKDVLDIMKDAGVDFLTPAPVDASMTLFDETLTALEKILLPNE